MQIIAQADRQIIRQWDMHAYMLILSIGQAAHAPLQRSFGGSPTKHLDVAIQPGDDVPGDVSCAVGHGLDLCGLQPLVPDVHLA